MDSTLNQHHCKNCGNEFTKDFCNNCGQKISHRITLPHIWHDLVHAFTHADKGIFHLFFQMWVRPGVVSREYIIEGKRKKYFNPFQYMIIIGSIAAFVAVNSHFMEQLAQTTMESNRSQRQTEFMQMIMYNQSKFYNILLLVQLPFQAWATYLLFKSKKLNYAEHLTFHTFVTAQNAILGMGMMLIIGITKIGISVGVLMSLVSISYNMFASLQFFEIRTVGGFFKTLFSVLLGLLFYMIFITVVIFILMLIYIAKTKGH